MDNHDFCRAELRNARNQKIKIPKRLRATGPYGGPNRKQWQITYEGENAGPYITACCSYAAKTYWILDH
jgi:hypothetical protein